MIGRGKKKRHVTIRLTDCEAAYVESFATEREDSIGISISEAFTNMIHTFANYEHVRKNAEKITNEIIELENKKESLLVEIEKLDSVVVEMKNLTKDIYRSAKKNVEDLKKTIQTTKEPTVIKQETEEV